MTCEHEKLQEDRSVRSDALTIVEYVLCDRCGRMYELLQIIDEEPPLIHIYKTKDRC
jgi:hypothetical protein